MVSHCVLVGSKLFEVTPQCQPYFFGSQTLTREQILVSNKSIPVHLNSFFFKELFIGVWAIFGKWLEMSPLTAQSNLNFIIEVYLQKVSKKCLCLRNLKWFGVDSNLLNAQKVKPFDFLTEIPMPPELFMNFNERMIW